MSRKPYWQNPPSLSDVIAAWSIANPSVVERFKGYTAADIVLLGGAARAYFQGAIIGHLTNEADNRRLSEGARRRVKPSKELLHAVKVTRAWLEFSP